MSRSTRLIKWMGDPPALIAGTHPVPRVANWHYENRRTIAAPGRSERVVLRFATERDVVGRPIEVPNGLSRDYHWDLSNKHLVLEMPVSDWEVLHRLFPFEFLDVTDVADPDEIVNAPLVYARPDQAATHQTASGG